MKEQKATLTTILIGLLFCFPVLSEMLQRYCNSRYGFCVSYPSKLLKDAPPVNGDGQKFYQKDGFEMTISGINNVLNETLLSEMKSQEKDLSEITYKTQGKNWFVLSGFNQEFVIYLKTYLGKGSINHLYIRYPKSLKVKYDPIVDSVSQSFNSGELDKGH